MTSNNQNWNRNKYTMETKYYQYNFYYDNVVIEHIFLVE